MAVLTDQVGAQKEKIRDLEMMLTTKRSRNGPHNMSSLEVYIDSNTNGKHVLASIFLRSSVFLFQRLQKLGLGEEGPEVEARKKELVSEVGNLKMRYASLEREKNETEKRLRQSEVRYELGMGTYRT